MAKKKYFTEDSLAALVDETKSYVDNSVSGKADANHSHSISDVSNLQSTLDAKVPSSRTVNGKALSSNITLSASDVGAAASSHTHDDRYYTESEVNTKISDLTFGLQEYVNAFGENALVVTNENDAQVLASAKSYTDEQIDAIVGEGASTTLDTIGEISAAIEDNQDMLDTLNSAIGNKADKSHTHDDRYYTETEIDSKVSTLNAAISGKAASSHSHAISDVTNLQSTLDGKAASSHTHSYAGSSSAGGAATSANKVNSSLTVKLNGGTTEGTNMFTFNGSAAKSVNITASGIGAAASSHTHDDRYYTESEIDTKVSTLNTAINGKAASSHTHSISNVTNLQTTLDEKLPKSGGTVTGNITLDNSSSAQSGEPYLQWGTVGSNAPYIGFAHDQSDGTFIICSMEKDTTTNGVKYYRNGLSIGGGSGNLFWKGDRVVTATDLAGYSTTSHTHNYAGSSSAGGSATSAVKLDTSTAGSATQPVYFTGGKPTACTYTLGKSVPSDAKFTDTTYTSLKNPYSLTIQGNGTTLTNGTYDGSAAKTVNITPASIGAATSSHTHPAGLGIAIDSYNNNAIKNTGVISVATGSTNGTISVQTGDTVANVAVKGLGSAAYTNTTAYDPAGAAADAYESAQVYTNTKVGAITYSSIGAAPSSHTHDDRYFTESEINTKLSSYLPLSGGTITGAVTFNASPIAAYNTFYNAKDSAGTTACLIGCGSGGIYLGSSNYPTAQKTVLVASGHTLRPDSNGSQNLGDSSYRWNNVYGKVANFSSTGTISGAATLGSTVSIAGITTISKRIQPVVDGDKTGYVQLGASDARFKYVYCVQSAMTTSDLNAKRDLTDIDDRYIELFDLIKPYAYYFKTGDRVHTGFISQYVEEAMAKVGLTAEELAFFCKDHKVEYIYDENGHLIGEEKIYDENGNPVYVYSLRYEEYIAIIVEKVKRLEKKYNAKLEELEKRLEALEA